MEIIQSVLTIIVSLVVGYSILFLGCLILILGLMFINPFWRKNRNKKFSKNEQEEFSDRFGEKAKKAISLMKISNARDMLDKKIDTSFNDASKLLKTEKNKLVEELKTIGKETGGDKMKKLKILGKLLNILGVKKPVSF